MRILTEMDAWSASTRYRALQFAPHLREVFAEVHTSLPHDSIRRPPGRVGQARYFGTHGLRYAQRAVDVRRRTAEDDALLIQRGLYPLGPAVVGSSLRRFPGRIVFDLDDAVFRPSPDLQQKGPAARWLYGPQQARFLLRRADAIVVSTAVLAESLPDTAVEPVILPTVPDPTTFSLKSHAEKRLATVGWAGTVGGLSYLDPLASVFSKLRSDGVAELEVVCSEPWKGPARFVRWSLPEEHTVFSRFDIGIMPLPDHAYTRAKAGFKLLQYMAAGLPVVASPIGVNADLIQRSGGGLLASTTAEWADALRLLSTDANLRARLGQSGRRFIEEYASITAKAQTLAELLHGAELSSPIEPRQA